ncbi:MAG: glutamate-5-semialdehyde dehydrogenase, partial [Planctomycetota bacterium]|nr:glutamate-5-semialdehyde dehydrogenase [Planctomycetota bacterium]
MATIEKTTVPQNSANQDLAAYALDVAQRAKGASTELASVGGAAKIDWLRRSATRLRKHAEQIVAANALDLEAAPGYGLTAAAIDRLRLDKKRIDVIATALEEVAALPDPIGEVIESTIRPNGLQILKTRVPLGVVFFIYESRPNVTADAAAICVKSGNAVILRGGKEAAHSSRAIVDLMCEELANCGLPRDAVQLVNTTDRAAVGHFLKLADYIDVAIPRGGEGLIRRVAEEARMPVIKHFTGNCHVYVDASADLEIAERIVINSKTQRMGVCNAAESLLVHVDVAVRFLPQIGAALAKQNVEIRGDERTRKLLPTAKTATEEDYAAEYLGPIISC